MTGAELTLHVDFHSGLGAWADYKQHVVDRKASPRALWAAQQFGDAVVEARDGAVAYDAPESSSYRWAKRRVFEVFAPAASAWRESVIAKALALVARTMEVG